MWFPTDCVQLRRAKRSPEGLRYSERESVSFEELHRTLVPLGCGAIAERAEITPLAGFRVLLARVETVLA
jgi:hypothetical protein